ncbi:EH domain-containing protein 1 [Tanacetum coccineum]|uniref:EH domain-containing protein 1 n=1 Tax=Tanacetum coccineum TaxID=301880 RepID=A0ABQ5DF43_9ASTR
MCGRMLKMKSLKKSTMVESKVLEKETVKTQGGIYTLDGDGRITGDDATKFFVLSNLDKSQLKQVWAIADSKRQGYLGFKDFIIAMQACRPVSLLIAVITIDLIFLKSNGILIDTELIIIGHG